MSDHQPAPEHRFVFGRWTSGSGGHERPDQLVIELLRGVR